MKHILIVDDSQFNLAIARDILKKYYRVSTADSGGEAIEFAKRNRLDMVLMDIEMPGMNGMDTLRYMKLDNSLGNIPVIFLTGVSDAEVEKECLDLGAQDFITKPFAPVVMLRRVQRVMEFDALRSQLEAQILRKTKEIESLTVQTITTFANSIDAKDSYTKSHSYNVAQYALRIGQILGWSELENRNLYYTALLHDIGKIGVPDYILKKADKLTEDEFSIIKRHPKIGARILKDITAVPQLSCGARNHHERYDGTGYPHGKKGNDIPLVGRIICVADAVDAMLSDRAYRARRSVEETIVELERCSGTQFDPFLVDIMCSILRKGIGDLPSHAQAASAHSGLLQVVMDEYIKSAQMDSLTGLWNRVYTEERVDALIKESNGLGALVLMDIDDFRLVNDRYDRARGDAVLRAVSEVILLSIEERDIAGRIDGDEFLVYYAEVEGYEAAKKRLEDVLAAIREKLRAKELPAVTISAGVAMMPLDGVDFASLYRNGDKSLYYVKKQGKDAYAFFRQSYVEAERAALSARPSLKKSRKI